MAQRTKNMLEAFQASKNAPAPTAATAPVRAKQAPVAAEDPPLEAGGPFAAVPHESEVAPSIELSVEGLVMQQRLRWVGIAVGAIACFAVGYVAGSPRSVIREIEVEAAEPAQPAPAEVAAPLLAEPTAAATRSERPSEPTSNNAAEAGPQHPIQDPANRYTILVATYGKSDDNLERAWALADYLAGLGFEAIPTEKGDNYFVVVSASAKGSLLEDITARIKELPGPRGREREFHDAYVVNISQIMNS